MLRKHLFFLGATVALLTACGDNKKTADAVPNDSATSKVESPSASNKDVLSTIKVNIKNGELAGNYEAACREGCTSYGIAGEKVFGNQYSEAGKGPKELSSLQLIVDDVNGNKQTKEFTMTISFGELFSKEATNYNIHTREGKKEGSGTLDLNYSGDQAVVKINGKTKEGVDVEVQIDAHKVLTMKNLTQ